MTTELSELRVQLQKISYESKENAITVDSLKEANQELISELEELKKSLAEMRTAHKEINDGEKEKKKAEKMAQMMSGFDPSGEINEKERQIRDALDKLDGDSRGNLSMEELVSLRRELAESKILMDQHAKTIESLTYEKTGIEKKKSDLETRFATLEQEYEELLDKTIAEEEAAVQKNVNIAETISTLKGKLETQYASKKEMQQKEIEDLKSELDRKSQDHQKLSSAMADLKTANDQLQAALAAQPCQSTADLSEREKDLERMRKTMAQQLADFEVMKKALMRDLQNRCERVVELEMSLDETREQYHSVLRASNNKAQQKKMAFLERNLEQLTNVQKQNASLKKEVALAERKLNTRNERIQNLETLLQNAQANLINQNQKFEAQLKTVRERLEQARTQKGQNSLVMGLTRIAKPLRGGGGASTESETPVSPVDRNDKRGSWMGGILNRT
ncbi:hypothetical protein CLU79DRAFT_437819 [Phycomyces nitens]|nr:hypothetical protein CLU79DRAFT_437819 [Phycomyces nitens]